MEKEKKIILIGRTGSGKTTLIQRIESLDIVYRKTQTIQNYAHFIDTPGEYLENRTYYSALLVTSHDADIIGFVQDCGGDDAWLPPMFSSAFSKEAVGIITKTDLDHDGRQALRAGELLRQAGAEKIFSVSAADNKGIKEIMDFIFKI